MPAENKIYVNGINGVTGEYLLPPMSLEEVVALAGGEKSPPGILSWLSKVWHKISTPHLGLPLGVDPADVTQAGWGIVFLKDEDPAVIAALLAIPVVPFLIFGERLEARIADALSLDLSPGTVAVALTRPTAMRSKKRKRCSILPHYHEHI